MERMQGTDAIHPETGIPAEITFSDRLTDGYADEIRRSQLTSRTMRSGTDLAPVHRQPRRKTSR